MDDRSDSHLLRDYAERRSDDAFAALVRRHIDLVHSAALRMVNDSHLAQDVTQNTFVALAKNATELKTRPVIAGWLHRTAQNIAAQTVRTDVRRRNREQEATAMNTLLSDSGTGVSPVWSDIAPHLDIALGELDEPDRDAVLLRYFEKKSAREMAAQLGISDDAAQKRVSRAVERLREFFAKRGVTVGAGGLAVVISANAVNAAPVGLAITISTAAALAGATLATATTATAIKTIAMTTLQKTVITATLAVVAGVGIYEARQNARLREQNQMLQQERAPLAEQIQRLQVEHDAATNQIAALVEESLRNKSNNTELLRLRGEVGLVRRQNKSLPAVNDKPVAEQSQTFEKGFGSLGEYLSAENATDAGNSTPEALLQTFVWAIREGKATRLAEIESMFGGQSRPGDVVGEISESQAAIFKMMQSAFTNSAGFRLSSKPSDNGEKHHVRLDSVPMHGRENDEFLKNFNLTFVLERAANGWSFGNPTEAESAK